MHKYRIPSRRAQPPLTALRNLKIHKVLLRLRALSGTTVHRRYRTRTYASLYERYTSGTVEKRQVRAQKTREDVMQTFTKVVCRHSFPLNPVRMETTWDYPRHLIRVLSPLSGRILCCIPGNRFPKAFRFCYACAAVSMQLQGFQYSGEIFSILARQALATGLLHAGVPGSDSASSNHDADNNSFYRASCKALKSCHFD